MMKKLNDSIPLHLQPCTDQDLIGVLRWFKSEKAVHYWAGPGITFPLQIKRFKTDSKFDKSQSFVLKQDRTLLAFGQIYNRLDHCHLGRLVVSPSYRGQGIGRRLVEVLLEEGHRALGLSKSSLFVLSDNKPAMKLYQNLGFVEAEYPQTIPLENCLYLTRSEKPD